MRRILALFCVALIGLSAIAIAQTAGEIRNSGGSLQVGNGSTFTTITGSSVGSCSVQGQMRRSGGQLQFCNGSSFINVAGGATAGGCSTAGQMRRSGSQVQFCDGSNFRVLASAPAPVNGSCGSAESGASTSAPTSSLCSVGSASSVTTNSTTFTWTCSGSNGGSNDSCSKPRRRNGVCGSAASGAAVTTQPTTNLCSFGAFVDTPTDTSSAFRWTCNGINGGSNTVCQRARSGTASCPGISLSGSASDCFLSPSPHGTVLNNFSGCLFNDCPGIGLCNEPSGSCGGTCNNGTWVSTFNSCECLQCSGGFGGF